MNVSFPPSILNKQGVTYFAGSNGLVDFAFANRLFIAQAARRTPPEEFYFIAREATRRQNQCQHLRAKRDRESFALFMEHQPATLETTFELWQHRVDKPESVNGEWPKHSNLFPIEALEYSTVGNVSSPTGKTLAFNVIAGNSHQAGEKVLSYLEYHGLGRNWAIRSTISILVLS